MTNFAPSYVTGRWKPSKRSQNMLLNLEEWAKDMVESQILLFISHQVILFLICARPSFTDGFQNWEFSGVWHFDQMLLREEEAVA